MREYGCHDHPPFHADVAVQDGWHWDGRRRMIAVPFRMEPSCQYSLTDLGKADARCDGCKHRIPDA